MGKDQRTPKRARLFQARLRVPRPPPPHAPRSPCTWVGHGGAVAEPRAVTAEWPKPTKLRPPHLGEFLPPFAPGCDLLLGVNPSTFFLGLGNTM